MPIYDDRERQAAALAMQHALAHDLRAPLRHIHAFSSLLREQIVVREDAEALRLLRVITDAAGQADHMVAALARLASLEAADVNISAEPGRAPDVDMDSKSVVMGTEKRTVDVPTVETEEKEIDVPVIGVTEGKQD